MLKAIKASLAFMTPKERFRWYSLTGLRISLSFFDLAGILAIGFIVASTAIFLTSGSDPDRVLVVGGLSIPAVNSMSLPWVSGGALVLFVSKAIMSLLLTRQSALFIAKIEARAATQIVEISLGSDLSRAREKSREEILFAMQVGAPSAFSGLLNQVGTIISEGALFVIVVMGFFFVDPMITVAAIIYFSLIALSIQFFVGTLMNRSGAKLSSGTVLANTAVTDLISVFRELSVLKARNFYVEKVHKFRAEASWSAANQYFLSGMPRYVIESALLVGVALFAVAQTSTGNLISSAATIGVFLSGGFRLTAAMLPLQSALLTVKGMVPQAKMAQEILSKQRHEYSGSLWADSRASDLEDPREKPLPPLGIRLNKVDFSYPSQVRPTIKNINMEILPGSKVALIGPSGAGKSTIADIMCGLLSPTNGNVETWMPLMDVPNSVIPAISYVPQKPGLVSGTFAQNVALGVQEGNINVNLLLECLSRAHLLEVIKGLPDGIESDLGKLQDSLSGGQAQRLGLARALYAQPGLLILDEATSALDAESESEISEALNELRGSVTVIVIAHRLNTVQDADNIFLIENGAVTDRGDFKSLAQRNLNIQRMIELTEISLDDGI